MSTIGTIASVVEYQAEILQRESRSQAELTELRKLAGYEVGRRDQICAVLTLSQKDTCI